MHGLPLASPFPLLSLFLGLTAAQCPSNKSAYPKVTLPWGTVQATACDNASQLYTFSNVRFGKPTNGRPGDTNATVRFGPSAFPADVTDPVTVMLPSTGAQCLQIDPTSGPTCKTTSQSPHLGAPLLAPHGSDATQSEDCLFLDIYVPISAVSSLSGSMLTNLPVIVWFYGGHYLFGAKDAGFSNGLPLYSGAGLVEAAQSLGENIIFVAGNYRLGQLGWLAGPAMVQQQEADGSVVLNAGLSDQRLLLQFVQEHIAKFGGDSSSVTAFGESAGAGSILHHLVAQENGSARDPLFHRAVMQSAAFEWLWDNSAGGPSDVVFGSLASQTSCKDKTGLQALACLQGLSSGDLMSAMNAVWDKTKCSNVFSIGPIVDGKVITQLPAVSLESSEFQFHPRVESVISSHVADEAKLFVPTYMTKTSGFNRLLTSSFPGNTSVREQQLACITTAYCGSGSCADQKASAKAMIQDVMFTCNTRFVYDAVARQGLPVYLMDYAFFEKEGAAVHATDLLPTFWNSNTDTFVVAARIHDLLPNIPVSVINNTYLKVLKNQVRSPYQRYLVNYAVNGVPSNNNNPVKWKAPSVTGGGMLANVMKVTGLPFNYFQNGYQDPTNPKTTCQFWATMANDLVQGLVPSSCPHLYPSTKEMYDFDEL
jgi:carboxylesterase type B